MQNRHGWDQEFMASLFKKETTYNTPVTVNNTNFCALTGHEDFKPELDDAVANDKNLVTGVEYGRDQEITDKGFKLSVFWPNATPNVLTGFIALCEGNITSTKDGANDAYTHDIEEADGAAGTALPSIDIVGRKADKQWIFPGIKGAGYEIKGEAGKGKYIGFGVDLVGSGTRTANADSFANKVTESWMRLSPSTIKMASGADISIDATLTQGTQNISATTPTNLSAAVKSFNFKRTITVDEQRLGAENGVCNDISYDRRAVECGIGLRYSDYISLYENQTVLALEIECKQGSKIDADGTLYYGFKIVIPRCKLKKAPLPEGGVDASLVMNFELDIQSDGTNPVFKIQTYNAVPAYLAP